jgi:hypothetical protein
MAPTEFDPIALQHFEILPEPVPAEVLGTQGIGMEVWAVRLAGGPVREVLTSEPDQCWDQGVRLCGSS